MICNNENARDDCSRPNSEWVPEWGSKRYLTLLARTVELHIIIQCKQNLKRLAFHLCRRRGGASTEVWSIEWKVETSWTRRSTVQHSTAAVFTFLFLLSAFYYLVLDCLCRVHFIQDVWENRVNRTKGCSQAVATMVSEEGLSKKSTIEKRHQTRSDTGNLGVNFVPGFSQTPAPTPTLHKCFMINSNIWLKSLHSFRRVEILLLFFWKKSYSLLEEWMNALSIITSWSFDRHSNDDDRFRSALPQMNDNIRKPWACDDCELLTACACTCLVCWCVRTKNSFEHDCNWLRTLTELQLRTFQWLLTDYHLIMLAQELMLYNCYRSTHVEKRESSSIMTRWMESTYWYILIYGVSI